MALHGPGCLLGNLLGRAAEMLYVGLSRARDLLVVCADPGLIRATAGPGVSARLGIA